MSKAKRIITKRDVITKATQAGSDLNVFYAIIAILEGGTIHAPSHVAADRIITVCKNEAQKRLREYDTAVALLEAMP